MTSTQSLAAYLAAIILLTITPGLDTALVLRAAICDGRGRASAAALGIAVGTFCWGMLIAAGLGAVLETSPLAFTVLKWAGAAYLAYLGGSLLFRPRRKFQVERTGINIAAPVTLFRQGFFTNILNPKVGIFYLSFLPQFVPASAPVAPFVLLLAVIHVILGCVWFLTLIMVMEPATKFLQRRSFLANLDRVTGMIFLGFGARLAISQGVSR